MRAFIVCGRRSGMRQTVLRTLRRFQASNPPAPSASSGRLAGSGVATSAGSTIMFGPNQPRANAPAVVRAPAAANRVRRDFSRTKKKPATAGL